MSSLGYSQDTLIRRPQNERVLIEGSDTFIVIPFMRAKILFGELAKLSEYKHTSDKLLALRDSTIQNGKLKQSELEQGIAKLEEVIKERAIQIGSLEQAIKNKVKIWIRRFIYGSAGGLIVGTIAGILIAK